LKNEHPAAGSITAQITTARLLRLKKGSKDIIAPFLAATPCLAMRNFIPLRPANLAIAGKAAS
jgi:hypothetical protein